MDKLSLPQLLTLILLFTSLSFEGTALPKAASHLPSQGPAEFLPAAASGDPFQLCLTCRCCAADDPTNCSSMPCCFGIDCNLPDKPYGVCAFVPKSCNCTSCT